MSLNFPQGREISDTVSHMGMSTGFPEGPIMYVLGNDREIILVGMSCQIEMPPINSKDGVISVSDSNQDLVKRLADDYIDLISYFNVNIPSTTHESERAHERRTLNTRIIEFLIEAFIPWSPNPGWKVPALLTIGGFLLVSISLLLHQIGFGPPDPSTIEIGRVAFYTGIGRATHKLDS